eukprot:CAMPEP_0173079076 /NCGR_PEP_ID=MMETSP1102-20130122/14807_1 /TAXON_ID=49646 /ORGANISM="Geminigera sp., Strain Caron Lab Isolate" /LENGTH=67 /DNA_ID=CAMNT_0013951087 /DNA_START=941 /DNA_END=1141 /DNA_ORIENTATION=+
MAEEKADIVTVQGGLASVCAASLPVHCRTAADCADCWCVGDPCGVRQELGVGLAQVVEPEENMLSPP